MTLINLVILPDLSEPPSQRVGEADSTQVTLQAVRVHLLHGPIRLYLRAHQPDSGDIGLLDNLLVLYARAGGDPTERRALEIVLEAGDAALLADALGVELTEESTILRFVERARAPTPTAGEAGPVTATMSSKKRRMGE